MILTKQSRLFTKTRKESPQDEQAKNAQLLIRAGYIHKEMAGVYAFLPLGLRVLKKIEEIVREEMNMIGGQELQMTALQEKSVWEKTDRWDDEKVDNWFKTQIKNGSETGLAITHEEPLTNIMSEYVSSYKDLPFSVYQFQTKFRNETRAKSGIMRGREFLMKDLYSFCKDKTEHEVFYEKAKQAYFAVFNRLGLGAITYLTFASGGIFSKFSHEFQTISSAGEDTIYVSKEKKIAVNKEVLTGDVLKELGLTKEELVEQKAIEVGNIFTLGQRFSEPLDLSYLNETGEKNFVYMGSYGIGVSRLVGTIVEVLSDERGIVWPESVAPYDVHVVYIPGSEAVVTRAEEIAQKLSESMDVLYDDRDLRAGEKFADSDLLGIPYRIIVSERGITEDTVEIKRRSDGETIVVKRKELEGKKLKELFS